ncbi:MAG: hypothetical protein KKE17_12425 [Proteobacteria bacterium]|nr:hypothetical protein [Pseudomonadota bacterium]MBU1710804.1 hypothetical protein [Pseudomonadota bacterium]
MKIKPKQKTFLGKRGRVIRACRYAGPVTLIAIILLPLILHAIAPQLVNPFEVVSGLQSGTLEQSSLVMMAILLPVLLLFVCLVLIIVICFVYVTIFNE